MKKLLLSILFGLTTLSPSLAEIITIEDPSGLTIIQYTGEDLECAPSGELAEWDKTKLIADLQLVYRAMISSSEYGNNDTIVFSDHPDPEVSTVFYIFIFREATDDICLTTEGHRLGVQS